MGHHYSRRKGIQGLELITWDAMLRLEHEAQTALYQAAQNFPGPLPISLIMRLACFPLGTKPYQLPSDALTKELSKLLTTPSQLRDLFQENLYLAPEDSMHQVSDLVRALPVCVQADKIASALRKEKRQPTSSEQNVLQEAEALRDVLIQVNVFETHEERPALQGTMERLQNAEYKTFDDFYHEDIDKNNVV